MSRHALLLTVSIAEVFACTGCTGTGSSIPSGPIDPGAKLELRSENGGHHGGGSKLEVDRAGHYLYRTDRRDNSGGGRVEECEGGLEAAIAQTWIDRVTALPLIPHDDEAYREMIGATDSRRGGFFVVYHPSTGVAQMPGDKDTHDTMRAEAKEWMSTFASQRPKSESCRVIRDDGRWGR